MFSCFNNINTKVKCFPIDNEKAIKTCIETISRQLKKKNVVNLENNLRVSINTSISIIT